MRLGEALSSARSQRPPCGTCVYAHAVSAPGGARVSSAAAYWPMHEEQAVGLADVHGSGAIARPASAHGIGSVSAQSTLIVELS